MSIFERKKDNRAKIVLSLSSKNMEDLFNEIDKFKNYADYIEWCVDGFEGSENFTKEEFLEKIELVKRFIKPKKMIVDYKGEELVENRIIRWSMGIADIVDVDSDNTQLIRLVHEARRKHTKTLISHHEFERMPKKDEIAEMYLKMEKNGGDILKIAAVASNELETYEMLEGAAQYSRLKKAKPIVAIAMGEEGQVSRICAGDFGSVLSYACGSKPTAPGQFDAMKLTKYMDTYYKEK